MVNEPCVSPLLTATPTTKTCSSPPVVCQTKQLLIRICRELAERLGKHAEALLAAVDDRVTFRALYRDTLQIQQRCAASCQLLHEHLTEHGC